MISIDERMMNEATLQAGIRYLGTLEVDERIRTLDTLGTRFLEGPTYRMFIHPWLRSYAINSIESQWPGGFGYSLVRSRIGDTEFSTFDGQQIVSLGAGFCTRAIRYGKHFDEPKRLFELDRSSILTKKKRVLGSEQQTKNMLSELSIHFIPIEIEKLSVGDVLLRDSAYNGRVRTLFIWEGMTMFVDDEVVDTTFGFIREHSGPRSLILFDYIDRDYVMSQGKDGKFFGGTKLYDSCKKRQDILKFGIPQREISVWLEERGFQLIKHWKRNDLEEQFLLGTDGRLIYKADGPLAICLARTIE